VNLLTGTRPRRFWLAGLLVTALALGIAGPGLASLTPSTFNAGDGDLIVTGSETDWATPAPNLQVGIDKPTGQTDDSFGQGTAENDPVPVVVDGSIPNNKSDLTRLYVANERVDTSEFLYLAWERVQEPTGTTNMDFEFNQSTELSSNGITPVRTAGDVLIKYDLAQGGTHPVLGYHLWATTGVPSQVCEAGNKLPCWDKVHAISGSNFEASINTVAVTDPTPPDSPRTLSARTFGEASINLTGAGILPSGTCKGFGRAYLKSRSSDSFTAALKDFIAPISVNISNCGTITIRKQTIPDQSAGSFAYTTTGGLTPSTFNLSDDGVQTFTDVQSGSYSVTETNPGAAWSLTDLSCTVSGSGTSATPDKPNRVVSITIAADGNVDCTFTNTKLPTLTVTKTVVPAADPGKFNLAIDGTNYATNVGNGGSTGAQIVSIGQHTASESAGTGTTLGNYDSVIGGDCASNGTVTLAAGDNKTCTITNSRKPTLTVTKVLVPSTDTGKFNLLIDGTAYASNVGNGGTTGAQIVSVGSHTASETAGTGTNLGDYISVIGGDCAANGTVSLSYGDNKTCVITNTRRTFTVITLVCEGSQLYSSTITLDGADKKSLPHGSGGLPATEAQLCALGGASYTGLLSGDHPMNAHIGLTPAKSFMKKL
jgi:hypothetical protein